MWSIDKAYIDGAFVPVTGNEILDIINPTSERVIGKLSLASREDARRAIAAAFRAQKSLSGTTTAERLDMLESLQAAILRRSDDIRDSTVEEYGAPTSRARWISQYASDCFGYAAEALRTYRFERKIGEVNRSNGTRRCFGIDCAVERRRRDHLQQNGIRTSGGMQLGDQAERVERYSGPGRC